MAGEILGEGFKDWYGVFLVLILIAVIFILLKLHGIKIRIDSMKSQGMVDLTSGSLGFAGKFTQPPQGSEGMKSGFTGSSMFEYPSFPSTAFDPSQYDQVNDFQSDLYAPPDADTDFRDSRGQIKGTSVAGSPIAMGLRTQGLDARAPYLQGMFSGKNFDMQLPY